MTLCSVVFLDALTTDFTIEEVLRVSEQRHKKNVKGGEGILNWKILPQSKVEVKVCCLVYICVLQICIRLLLCSKYRIAGNFRQFRN